MKKNRANKKGGLMGMQTVNDDNVEWTIPEYNMQAEVKILTHRKFYRYHVS